MLCKVNLASNKPRVCTLLAGRVQILRVDQINHEPDILQFDVKLKTRGDQLGGTKIVNVS